MRFLTPEEVAAWSAFPQPAAGSDLAAPLKRDLQATGQMTKAQVAGRNFPIGCVNLEITQRCNLDCTLCYLSDNAEAIRDLPMPEVLRRIARIRDHYGPGTNVQISGGDPTMRARDDLIATARAIAEHQMVPSLLTNGIKATRSLLKALAEAGLKDVVFHVDLTQERKGYATEAELNAVRRDYIERARGLGLRILINTTVFGGNVAQMPDLVRFFVAHARDLHMVSFQMQADTGRGVIRERDDRVSVERMIEDIRAATGVQLSFDMPQIGHSRCNRYSSMLISGSDRRALYEPQNYFIRLLAAAQEEAAAWRARRWRLGALRVALKHPGLAFAGLRHLAAAAWTLRRGLITTGRVDKLSFYIHNFMGADQLERDRCQACIFMAATAEGPMSMCVYNAKREAMLAKPLQLDGTAWDPVQPALPASRLKGRQKAAHPGNDAGGSQQP